jgi:hypothetical protein
MVVSEYNNPAVADEPSELPLLDEESLIEETALASIPDQEDFLFEEMTPDSIPEQDGAIPAIVEKISRDIFPYVNKHAPSHDLRMTFQGISVVVKAQDSEHLEQVIRQYVTACRSFGVTKSAYTETTTGLIVYFEDQTDFPTELHIAPDISFAEFEAVQNELMKRPIPKTVAEIISDFCEETDWSEIVYVWTPEAQMDHEEFSAYLVSTFENNSSVLPILDADEDEILVIADGKPHRFRITTTESIKNAERRVQIAEVIKSPESLITRAVKEKLEEAVTGKTAAMIAEKREEIKEVLQGKMKLLQIKMQDTKVKKDDPDVQEIEKLLHAVETMSLSYEEKIEVREDAVSEVESWVQDLHSVLKEDDEIVDDLSFLVDHPWATEEERQLFAKAIRESEKIFEKQLAHHAATQFESLFRAQADAILRAKLSKAEAASILKAMETPESLHIVAKNGEGRFHLFQKQDEKPIYLADVIAGTYPIALESVIDPTTETLPSAEFDMRLEAVRIYPKIVEREDKIAKKEAVVKREFKRVLRLIKTSAIELALKGNDKFLETLDPLECVRNPYSEAVDRLFEIIQSAIENKKNGSRKNKLQVPEDFDTLNVFMQRVRPEADSKIKAVPFAPKLNEAEQIPRSIDYSLTATIVIQIMAGEEKNAEEFIKALKTGVHSDEQIAWFSKIQNTKKSVVAAYTDEQIEEARVAMAKLVETVHSKFDELKVTATYRKQFIASISWYEYLLAFLPVIEARLGETDTADENTVADAAKQAKDSYKLLFPEEKLDLGW